jgi:holo-[acyl-carrier protein] synthase
VTTVLGIGVDLVETARIESSLTRFGDRFRHRVFADGEIAYSHSMKYPARHFAARFAAKEAVSKAFGTGIGAKLGWREIEIQRRENGEPFVVLNGGAKEFAASKMVTAIHVSLSHTDHYAVANAVVLCNADVRCDS